MPPKAKFTKEEIVSAALEIVKRSGIDALTARSLGYELKSSPRPIFTVFNSMDEVQREVIKAANALYGTYMVEGLNEENAFKGSGKGYIRFAVEEPKLFQLLFMREQESVPDIESALKIGDYYESVLHTIQSQYGVKSEVAERIYEHLWIYSHGIAVLLATKFCAFSEEEISSMLGEVGKSIIKETLNVDCK